MKAVIYYDDGSVLHVSSIVDWELVDRHGVLIVKEIEREPNDLVHMGMDYYWLEDGQVKSCNARDLDRYLERPQGLKCMKFGRWADDAVWKKAHDQAMGIE